MYLCNNHFSVAEKGCRARALITHSSLPSHSYMYSLFFPTDSVSTQASVSIGSRLRRACLWLCGLEKPERNSLPAPPPPPDPTINSLEEDRCMRGVMDANLIVCISVAIFLIAYWA